MEMYSAVVDTKLEQRLIYGFVQPIYINLIQRIHKKYCFLYGNVCHWKGKDRRDKS